MEQVLTAEFRGQSSQTHVHVTLATHRIQVLGLSPLATPLFVLRYDGARVRLEPEDAFRRPGAMPLTPESVLADLQLVFWPRLPDRDGWTIRDETGGDAGTRVRRAWFRGELIAEVHFPDTAGLRAEYRLVHHRYRYQLIIRNVNVRTAP